MVAILDYGVGNLLAIQNIITKVGGKAVITHSSTEVKRCEKLILPGVGAFGYGMKKLRDSLLIEVLHEEVIVRKKKILGLCLGAQIMTRHSQEGDVSGLGWVSGQTVKFNSDYVKIIPHMGWADIEVVGNDALMGNIENPRFYFTHSYHFQFQDVDSVTAFAWYGYKFACAFQKDNIFGVQFHPEKSHRYGMKFFENFLNL
jgi:glutamine amidotransferase